MCAFAGNVRFLGLGGQTERWEGEMKEWKHRIGMGDWDEIEMGGSLVDVDVAVDGGYESGRGRSRGRQWQR